MDPPVAPQAREGRPQGARGAGTPCYPVFRVRKATVLPAHSCNRVVNGDRKQLARVDTVQQAAQAAP